MWTQLLPQNPSRWLELPPHLGYRQHWDPTVSPHWELKSSRKKYRRPYRWFSQVFAKSREKVRQSCLKMEMRCNCRVRAVDWNTQDVDGLLGRRCTRKQHVFKKHGRQPHFNRLSPHPFFNLTSKKRSPQFLCPEPHSWKYLSHLD